VPLATYANKAASAAAAAGAPGVPGRQVGSHMQVPVLLGDKRHHIVLLHERAVALGSILRRAQKGVDTMPETRHILTSPFSWEALRSHHRQAALIHGKQRPSLTANL